MKHSKVFSADNWHDSILFAREDASYRLICFASTDDELQIHVEPVNANILRAAESAWRGIRKVLAGKDPRLTELMLVDAVANREILSGRSGLRAELAKRETIAPVLVGGIVTLYALIGVLTFAEQDPWRFLFGAVSGVVAGLVALFLACVEARKGVLRWS